MKKIDETTTLEGVGSTGVLGIRPRRVQLSRAKGWKMPPNTVKVDRTTQFGNPFKVCFEYDQQHAVDLFRKLINSNTLNGEVWRSKIEGLRGKNLACWCLLNDPCHAEDLLMMANKI